VGTRPRAATAPRRTRCSPWPRPPLAVGRGLRPALLRRAPAACCNLHGARARRAAQRAHLSTIVCALRLGEPSSAVVVPCWALRGCGSRASPGSTGLFQERGLAVRAEVHGVARSCVHLAHATSSARL